LVLSSPKYGNAKIAVARDLKRFRDDVALVRGEA